MKSGKTKTISKVSFLTKDGLQLTGVWHFPKKETTKAIILAHGITVDKDEDNQVFVKLATLLSNHGFAVFRFDFRGSGESEGKSVDMTIRGELLDLDAAFHEVMKKGYSRIGIQGNSFGGGIATLYTAQNPNNIICLSLWNPVLNYDHCFLNPYLPWIVKKIGHIRMDLKEKGWTTLGSRKFIVGKPLFDEMKLFFPFKEIRNIHIPLMIIHSDKDIYVPYEDSKTSVSDMKNATLVTIKNGVHGFSDFEDQRISASNTTLKFFQKELQ